MKIVSENASVAATEDADDVIATPINGETTNSVMNTNNNTLSPEQAHLVQTFPWILEFIKLARAEIGVTNLRTLERLMRFYQKQAYPSVKECYSRPNRAAKLKRVMSDALLFFHSTYTELKLPLEHSSYLAKMSDLMAMYLDMEIKASRTGTESLPKIASKLTSSLHVYFGRSQDHILDTVLKSKIITKNFWELSDLIFRRILRDSPGSSLYVMSYIRYLLAFKMWKGIMKGAEERKRIAKLAILKLQAPPGFREKMMSPVLRDLLPRIPKSRTDVTAFLMQAKFPVRDKAKMFLKAVVDPKLQCALDRQSFCANEVSYEQDDNESNLLMNDIWSSMNNETGIRDPLRLGVIEHKKYQKLKNNPKAKVEQMKKRRKKIEVPVDEVGEDDLPMKLSPEPVKSIKVEVPEGVSIKLSEKTIDEVAENDVSMNMEVAAEVEVPPNPPSEDNASVKEEPLVSLSKGTQPVFQDTWKVQNFETHYRTNEYSHETNLKVAGETVLIADEQNIAAQEHSDDLETLAKASISIESADINDENHLDDIYVGSMEVVETAQPVEEEVDVGNQEYKPVDTFNNGVAEAEKLVSKNCTTSTEYNTQESAGIGMLHDYTIRSDTKMYEFQMKVYSYSTRLTARTWINLLSPLFCEQSRLKMYRCWCSGCKNNLSVIRRNWKSVMACIMINSDKSEEDLKATDENGYTYEDSLEDLKAVAEGEKGDIMYWETEIESLLKRIDEFVKEDSESSNLPLKKRKAFSYNNYVKEAEKRTNDVSYPCTPMISIAEIELLKEKLRLNAMAASQTAPADPINYVTNLSTKPVYSSIVSDSKYNSVIVQTNVKHVIPEQTLVPGAYTTTYLPSESPVPEHQETKIKFKTPAQLKEFQHLSAAQDLINFAHSSRAYCEKQEPPPKRQTRQKNKSQSRKRKRT